MAQTSSEVHDASTVLPAGDRAPARPSWFMRSLAALRHRPLATCAAAFILGVACGPHLRLSLTTALIAAAALLGACIAVAATHRPLGALFVVLALAAGVAWREANSTVPADDISRLSLPTRAALRGTAITAPSAGRSRAAFVLGLASVRAGDDWQRASGKVRVSCAMAPEGLEQGSRVELVGSLRPIRSATNPGEFSYARYLARQGISTEAIVGPGGVRRWERPARRTLAATTDSMRDTARLALHQTMPGPNKSLYASLVASMVYGVTAAPLPSEIVERFRQSGTIHVLVVSGAQISLLAFWVLRATRGRPHSLSWWHLLVIPPALFLFALMVGYGPSVRRAVWMCTLWLFSGAVRRDYDPYTALAVAAGLLALFDPSATQDVGAQLSFAAAFGVIHFAPRGREPVDPLAPSGETATTRVRRFAKWVLYCSFGAWVMVLPILAHHFHSFPALSGLSNIAVVPLSGVLVVTGFLATGAALVFPPLAVAINWFNRGLIDAVLAAVRIGAALPLGYETATYMSLLTVILWYAAVLLVVAVVRSEWREHLTVSNVLLAVLIVAALGLAYHAVTLPPDRLAVTMLDVGDGDCMVIRSPSGRTMLVDAGERLRYDQGSDVARRVVLPYLLMHGIRRLDYVVITHPHDDHMNGIPTVLSEMRVGQVLDCGMPGESAAYEGYAAALRAQQVTRRAVRRGERIDLGGGVVAAVLAPAQPFLRGTDDDLNNNSVVLKLVYGEVSFLLTGDLQAEGQTRLLRSGANLRVTVLKVPHHGAAEAAMPEFLRAVSPDWALISASGSTRLGHPSPVTIERLQTLGAEIRRTDMDGAITVETDGREVSVRSFATAEGR